MAVVILVGGIWIGPRLFDWSRHRAAIEAAASGFLGRNVVINGPIRLTLLPHPSITAEKVDVQDDGDGVRMAARDLTLNLSLGALVTGRVDVTHITLERPDIRLPWPLPSGPSSIEPPPWLASLSAEITRGRLYLGPLDIEEANLTVATGGADTALQLDGTASLGGKPWQMSLSLSWPHMDGSAPIKATMRSTSGPDSAFDFAGDMKANGKVDGQLTAHGADLSSLLPTPPISFDANGTLAADKTGVRLDGLSLILGTMPADGDMRLALVPSKNPATPNLALRLHTPMLDLGPWLKAFPTASTTAPPLSLDLDADAVIYGDGLMRRVGLKVETAGTLIQVQDGHASLPGEAGIDLSGDYDTAAQSFTGHMGLSAPSPAVTLHWLVQSKMVPNVSTALAGLGSLAVSSDVSLAANRLAMTGLLGRMDDTRVSGNLLADLGDHPSISAGLDFGKIDLGSWLPPAWLTDPPRPDVLVHGLAGITADLRLTADEVWLGDEEIDHAVLDASVANGGLNLRQLAGQDDALQVMASGAIDAQGVVRRGRLVATAQPATRLMGLLPARLQGNPGFWAEPLAASVTANGPPSALALTMNATLGDITFSAQPVLDLPDMRWHGPVTLRHPNAARLLEELGFGNATAWLGEGSLSVVANASSDGAGWQIAPLTFSMGMLHGAGRVSRSASRAPDERGVVATLAIDTLPWPDPDLDEPIPVDLLRGWQATLDLTIDQVMDGLSPVAAHVVAEAGVADGALTVGVKSASMLGGVAHGQFRLDGSQPPLLTAALALDGGRIPTPGDDDGPESIPVTLTADRLDAKLAVTAKGYSLASWLSSLGGTGSVSARQGILSGLNLAGAPQTPFGGETAFARLDGAATLSQGDLHLDSLQLGGAAGTIAAAGQVDLVRGVCNLNLILKPHDAAGTTAILQGPLRDPAHWIVHGTPGS